MIIGLSGYARSGKDTVAGMLMGIHGFERAAFADKIREFLLEIDPLVMHNGIDFRLQDIVESKGWETAKTDHPEVRRLLQDLGVGARKLFGDGFWVDQVVGQFGHDWWGYDKKVVITDVRFINEAKAIKGKGGQVWRINRINVGPANDHVSEIELDDWDFDGVITNNSDMPNLIKQVRALLG
jgi:hypothetical protein